MNAQRADEVALITGAARVADIGMDAAVEATKEGNIERLIAGAAEYAMRKAGAEGWATPVYVASGWRSAMAHRPASSKVIEAGDVVQVHVAPIVDGYSVDLCRTLFVGGVPSEARAALDAYVGAQEAGIAAATPGRSADGHRHCHGRGPRRPRIPERVPPTGVPRRWHGARRSPDPGVHAVIHGEEKVDNVEPGMVLAIGNCGIFHETFGVRAEDTVWVSSSGPQQLTRTRNDHLLSGSRKAMFRSDGPTAGSPATLPLMG